MNDGVENKLPNTHSNISLEIQNEAFYTYTKLLSTLICERERAQPQWRQIICLIVFSTWQVPKSRNFIKIVHFGAK